MKVYTGIEQGSDRWFSLRLGRPTASNFHRIVTKVKCDLSASAKGYALQLVAERLLRMPSEAKSGFPWMERGKEMESFAVQQYELVNDVTTVPVAFITTDDGRIGCSPDRLVAGDSSAPRLGLEVKCPSPPVHLEYLAAAAGLTVGDWKFSADDYRAQVQGQIYVGEFDRADLYSFHDRMPPATVQTYRDQPYIDKLSSALRAFTELLDSLTEQARKLGVYQAVAEKAAEAPELERELQGEAEKLFPYETGQA